MHDKFRIAPSAIQEACTQNGNALCISSIPCREYSDSQIHLLLEQSIISDSNIVDDMGIDMQFHSSVQLLSAHDAHAF